MWSALIDTLRLDWKSQHAAEQMSVVDVTRNSQTPGGHRYGLLVETSDGGRWEIALSGVMGR